jgi:hypothetical protein
MKMTRTVITAMVIGVLSVGAGYVQAAGGNGRGPASFSSYDTDGSGGISEQELNALREQRQAAAKAAGGMGRGMQNVPSFGDIDKNHDGEISAGELQEMQSARGMGRGQGRGHGKGMGMKTN